MSDIPMWPEFKLEKVATLPAELQGLPNVFPAGYMAYTRTESDKLTLTSFIPVSVVDDTSRPVRETVEDMARKGLAEAIAAGK